MKKIALVTAPFMAIAMLAAPAASEDKELTKGEIKLAKMLDGREAGEPTSCIRLRPTSNLTVIDGTALVYKQGRTLYVNIPRNARSVDDSDTIVTRPFGNNLCRTDIVTTVDRVNGFYTGNILLGDFVPYKKTETS